ncbi:MAG: hypothetical protein AMXMBFR33_03680 [Candidatus Xenobia bacterium]|jgi:DNA-binding response OmpR family regulator
MEMSSRKVLVVDDDEHILRSLAQYLELEEFSVKTASGGAEALALVESERPDLVVLDVMMPEMDGFEVLENLRRKPETEKLPVIMLTARDQHQDVLKGYQMGVSSYMVKPFNLDELVEVINQVFAEA